MEHRGLGRKTNRRVSNALRGRIAQRIEQRCETAGLRFRTVKAAGTSSFCSRCDARLEHRPAPDRDSRGYAWAFCPSCGHTADRDQNAAENIGQRSAQPDAGKVHRRKAVLGKARRKALAAARVTVPKIRVRRDKNAPTPRRPRRRAGQPEGLRPRGVVAPRHQQDAGAHRSAGPSTQARNPTPHRRGGNTVQCRADEQPQPPRGAGPDAHPPQRGPGVSGPGS
jgi:hypothetical protein